MKQIVFLCFLLVGLASAQLPPPIPTFSPPACQVQARYTGHRSNFGQRLLEISLPATCPLSAGRLTRILTRNGGRIPPVGYFRLGAGFPRRLSYWVLGPVQVQDRYAPNDWRDVPVQGGL